RLPGRVLGVFMQALAHGSSGALLLRAEGRSTVRDDRLPEWVERGTEFTLLEQLQGDVPGLVVAAPTLGEAVPDRFEQADLFSPLDPSQSALALLTASLDDAAAGNVDSDAFDDDLLRVFATDFARLFRRDRLKELTIQNGAPGARIRRFDKEVVHTLRTLRDTTPRPRRVRLAGRMDEARYSRCAFVLDLADGSRVRGVLVDARPETLKPFLGDDVVMEGIAQFRPSGRLLRVDVERLSSASSTDLAVFSTEPRPMNERLDVRSLRRPQSLSSGISSVFGKWPGTETDEEIDDFLRHIS
ncbi:MAG: hypothetical protein ABIT38_03370, partial [Gemmatimonadaceae bacterium]